jgi:hypothetical protein
LSKSRKTICPVAGAENVLWTGEEAGVIQLDEATELLTEIPRHTAKRHRFL